MSGDGFAPLPHPVLQVARRVVTDVVRFAAVEVPGVLRVGRHGPPWRGWLGSRLGAGAVDARVREDGIKVRIYVVARPGQSLPILAAQVRQAVGAAVERMLGLEVLRITVLVDGVGE